ncbi:MAG: type IV secretory system conjugative DNA transfer family protein [Anaplasmataceae bacterium]|nr:type IV secretory system conjugative DNA transfer family protein [Anaplasmataceae bacterium]
MGLLPIVIIFTVGVALAGGAFLLMRHAKYTQLLHSLQFKLYLVQIPKTESDKNDDLKQEIGKTEQLLSSLTTLHSPFAFEIAVPRIGEEIHFYISVPQPVSGAVIKQIHALWNEAHITEAGEDYTIFNPEGVSLAAFVKQKEDQALPIRTYVELEADSFTGILSGFSKIKEIGEGAAMQVIAEPAPGSIKKRIETYIRNLRQGESVETVVRRQRMPWDVGQVKQALNPEAIEKEKQERVIDSDAVESLERKISKPLFLVNVRLVASAPTPREASDILDGLAAGFSQFTSPRRNNLVVTQPRNSSDLVYDFIYRNFDPQRAMALNSEEVASLFHFPISSTNTPRVKWLKSKEAAPPNNLPDSGLLLGYSSFRGQQVPVHIAEEDRRRHVYVIGQTGTGKSTLLGSLIIEDVRAGKGVCLIDPHGDLVDTVLNHIPENRKEDVILFEPGDTARPMGLNMLDYDPNRPEEKTFIVNEIQGIFNKLFPPESMGPMFEQYMRNALLLLMEDAANEPATLIEVPRIFTDTTYRKRKLERITNPVVVDFWEKEAAKAGGEASLANMTPYITSKFNNFIANDFVRPIIGQPKASFRFREAMDEGKILLVNLSKGRIGDINASLLGMIFVGKILMAALSRVDISGDSRRDFYLYIDEFQNFTTDSIATILSEARKYRLNMVIAHQFIAQLTDKIKDSVFGNVGSQLVFRVGVQDAEFLAQQFQPVFSPNDLTNIDNFNAYAKLLINGQSSSPFNLKISTAAWDKGEAGRAEEVRQRSREKYGRERQIVENDILARLRI